MKIKAFLLKLRIKKKLNSKQKIKKKNKIVLLFTIIIKANKLNKKKVLV